MTSIPIRTDLSASLYRTAAGPGRERSATITTRRGEATTEFSALCADGTCSRERTVTGAKGKTATHTGSVTRTAPGTFTLEGQTTGPNGRSVQHSGTVTTSRGQ